MIESCRPATVLRLGVVAAVAAVVLAVLGSASAARLHSVHAVAACDLYADIAGNDSNSGSSANPVRHVRRLIELLAPGQTGCLRSGQTFHEAQGFGIATVGGGTPGSPVTIRSEPGGRASITGQLEIRETVHDVDFTDIDFEGLGAVGDIAPKGVFLNVIGHRIRLIGNDITSPKGICIFAGKIDGYLPLDQQAAVQTQGLVLDRNRIHGCGLENEPDLTEDDSGIHGVYLAYTAGAQVANNLVYDNINRGIQLWPRAEDTLIANNVLDGSGSNLHISAEAAFGHYSRRTTVRDNIITNAVMRARTDPDWPQGDTHEVFGYFPNDAVDYGNVVIGNCLFHSDPSRNTLDHHFGGFGYTHSASVFADPLYVNRGAKNFDLQPGSPCAGKGPQLAANCNGEAVTIAGTGGSDNITGTPGRDVISAGAGDDTISGLGGDDVICGGPGYDTLRGGLGNDVLDGEADADVADYGGAAAAVTVDLSVGSGTGEGSDTLFAVEDAFGSAFADRLLGSAMNNYLAGGGGEDKLEGRQANDFLDGGEANDTLDGGPGADGFAGGAGKDTALYKDRQASVSVTIDDVADDGEAGEGDNVKPTVENVTGGKGADTLVGSGGANTLNGGAGGDTLTGGGGKDSLKGGAGNDVLWSHADAVADKDACGAGTDTANADGLDSVNADCETVNRS